MNSMCRLIWICVLFSPFTAKANCEGVLATDQQIIVDNDVKNISVGVHPFGSVSILWSIGKQVYERIVLANANASNPLAKLRNGEFNCYKQGIFTEEECKRHFSLSTNASVDVIFRMRNVSDLYFGTYLLSLYGGTDPEIKTLWIRVYDKAGLTPTSTPMSLPTSMPMSMPTSMQTHKNDVTAGTSHLAVKIVVPLALIIGVGISALIAFWQWKKRSKRIEHKEAGGDESKEEEKIEMSELDSQDNLVIPT